MRRTLTLLTFAAALLVATSAAAAFEPIRRGHGGEVERPLVRAGTLKIPKGQSAGRVTVIAELAQPPLAARLGGTFAFRGVAARRLNVRSSASRAYLSQLVTAQRRAVAVLEQQLPEARVRRSYQVVLNGLAIDVPAHRLPALRRLSFTRKLYPSATYTQSLNRSPSLIGAPAFTATNGAQGAGIKIGIVDDGIDPANRFFNATGMDYPLGYPKGGLRWTTPKIIVARSFPGPHSGRAGRLAVDPQASFHGTHVAGIAAGRSGTVAPSGRDHPTTTELSGVAPGAWIGNYRVFNEPSPVGYVANTPEIVAAFEAAVEDGMDVINFSGGGSQVDPVNDPMYEVVANVAAAGVVPVISAGNDRDQFGNGTIGSPGTVPEAITVAAASNSHVFAPTMRVLAPGAPASLQQVPFMAAAGLLPPRSWEQTQTIIDVGAIMGRDGRPVDRLLCGPPTNLNGGDSQLPRGSLEGAIALVSRGSCTFVSKALRAIRAGADGIVVVDNRPGEPNTIPIPLGVPAGMISDLDGAQLRAVLAGNGGAGPVNFDRDLQRVETGRSNIIVGFSAGGPVGFEHTLKPDVTAPGGQILSATLPRFGGPFAVFDGTSMSAPHVTGAVALLLQRHPNWSPAQMKSALMSTAAPAWADTARAQEASVLLQGAGLVSVPAADNPRIFTEPGSLSYGDLKVTQGQLRRSLLLSVSDAGGGAGTWQVALQPQSTAPGTSVEVSPTLLVPPGGSAEISVTARASTSSTTGESYGFVILRQGAITRRVPYAFFVSRPGLELQPVKKLQRLQTGTTRFGASRVSQYRWPSAPFGPAPTFTGPPMVEDGAERVYSFRLNEPVINFGVAVIGADANSLVDPWLLGSLDENDVEGYAGTPVNVNSYTLNYLFDVGAAGAVFPRPKEYFVSVDSPRDPFTNRMLGGRYVLQHWVDDLQPPFVELITKRVSAGRPTIVARAVDFSFFPRSVSGVDPTSLVIGYRRALLAPVFYDRVSGIVIFTLPREAPRLPVGRTQAVLGASDFQESKNVSTPNSTILPNSTFRGVTIRTVPGPAVTWVLPEARACAARRQRLTVVASAGKRIRAVRFFDGSRRIGTDRRAVAGLYTMVWRTGKARLGSHRLRAVVVTDGGRASAPRRVRVCR